jgi:DNA-directed RNA polymerase specialized sigma24 family protein
MCECHTVTGLLAGVCAGDEEAINRLVALYLDRLAAVGRRTYRSEFANVSRPAEDEEDAALSALESFCAAARHGKVKVIVNRRQLWKLLVTITIRKVYDQRERATAKKRGGVNGVSVRSAAALEQAVSDLPAPDVVAELADTYREAMRILADDGQRRIASLDLQGKTREEIAQELGVTERTIYRELKDTREKWEAHFGRGD